MAAAGRSLRVRNNEFGTLARLQEGIDEAHARGKQFFVVSNIFPHNAKLTTYLADMAPVVALKPDALIMSDPGLIDMVREAWPDQVIHLSVQANTVNWAAVRFWQKIGVDRIILSRELSLEEVAEIRQQCPDIELEVFVHGALCIAYSGRCLLSGYFNHRDPNQGSCTNSCRWDYKVSTSDGATPAGCGQPLQEQEILLEEKQRPGELMPIEEDEHGTYIMNSKDLRAMEHVQRLVDIGIDSLKIEGRTKAPTTSPALPVATARRSTMPWPPTARSPVAAELDGLANRGYTDGFYRRHAPSELQNYDDGASRNQRRIFVGEVLTHDPVTGLADIDVKNRFGIGDDLELMTPHGSEYFRLDAMTASTAARSRPRLAPAGECGRGCRWRTRRWG